MLMLAIVFGVYAAAYAVDVPVVPVIKYPVSLTSFQLQGNPQWDMNMQTYKATFTLAMSLDTNVVELPSGVTMMQSGFPGSQARFSPMISGNIQFTIVVSSGDIAAAPGDTFPDKVQNAFLGKVAQIAVILRSYFD